MNDDEKYPEHAKLKKVKEKSHACGEFLDWLQHKKKFFFYTLHEHSEDCYVGTSNPRNVYGRERICGISTGIGLVPVGYVDTTKLLAEYFEIDTEKLEQEKMALLEELRNTK